MDPQLRTVEMRELGPDGRYIDALVVAKGVVESVPGCEGLTLDVDAQWGNLMWFEAEGARDSGEVGRQASSLAGFHRRRRIGLVEHLPEPSPHEREHQNAGQLPLNAGELPLNAGELPLR